MGWDVSKRSPTDPPTATGKVIHGQMLVISLSHLCPLCLGTALAGGLWLLPTDTVPALLPKAFPAIFG